MIEGAKMIIKNEGLFGLYKGFFPYFGKEAVFNIVIFCIYEKAKRILKLTQY